jgi:hypothetical protein
MTDGFLERTSSTGRIPRIPIPVIQFAAYHYFI